MFAALQRSCVSEKEKKNPPQNEDAPFDMDEFIKFLEEEEDKSKTKLFASVIPSPILTNYTNALNPLDVALYNIWSTSSPLHASASGFSGMFHSQNTASHKPLRR